MSDLNELLQRAEEIRARYEELNAQNGTEAWRIRDYAMGLMGDIGDLQKLIMAKENLRNIPDVDAKLEHELADCLWSLLIIANYYGIDLSKAFESTMDTISNKISQPPAQQDHV